MELNIWLLLLFFAIVSGSWFVVTRPSIKILEQTSNNLTFKIRSTFCLLIAIFVGGIGLLLLLGCLNIAPTVILSCDRTTTKLISTASPTTTPNCEIIENNWLGHLKSRTSITSLQGATEQAKIRQDDNGKIIYRYRVLLSTQTGDVPLTKGYYGSDRQYSYESRQALISQINQFVENPLEVALEVQEDNRVIGYAGFIISGFLFCLSLLIKALSNIVTCTLDRELDSITITHQSCLQKEVNQLAISRILYVEVERRDTVDGWTYRVILHLKSGLCFFVNKYYSFGFEEKQYVATLINDFLNQNTSEAKEEKSNR